MNCLARRGNVILPIDLIAEGLYRRAGLDPTVAAVPLYLALHLFGEDNLVSVKGTAFIATVRDGQLLVREGERGNRKRRGLHVATAIARWALGAHAPDDDVDHVAAALIAPSVPFRRFADDGEDFGELAWRFITYQRVVKLRYADVYGVRPIRAEVAK